MTTLTNARLTRLSRPLPLRGPVVQVIMDGIGVGKLADPQNAVARARTPNLDRLKREALYTELLAHGNCVAGTMAELLSRAAVQQLAISETQGFDHITRFWNGNNAEILEKEVWLEVRSEQADFAADPAMKAAEITKTLMLYVDRPEKMFVRVNYPNGETIGRTGSPAAVRTAVEVVDEQIGALERHVVNNLGGALVVTADHGQESNRVPFYIVLPEELRGSVSLVEPWHGPKTTRNSAATALNLLGFEAPAHMDPSLIEIKS